MYKIKTTPPFDEDLKKLDRQVAERVTEKIEYLAYHPELIKSPVKYLPKHLAGLKKYRVGSWRVYLWVNHEQKRITLYGVEHRGGAYKRFTR